MWLQRCLRFSKRWYYVTAAPETQVAFKNCAPFTKCITKIDGTTIDDAENLDLVMPMYSLIEYSSNCFETAASLWFYSKDEATDFNVDIANTNDFKSFKYNAKLLGNAVDQPPPNAAKGILKNAMQMQIPIVTLSGSSNQKLSKLPSKGFERSVSWSE